MVHKLDSPCPARLKLRSCLQEELKLSERQQLELLEVTRLYEANKARLEAAQRATLAKLHVRPLCICVLLTSPQAAQEACSAECSLVCGWGAAVTCPCRRDASILCHLSCSATSREACA